MPLSLVKSSVLNVPELTIYTCKVDEETKDRLYPLFLKNHLYSADGVFRNVWKNRNKYYYDSAWLSFAIDEGKPIGLSFLPKDCYYGWEEGNNTYLANTYGSIGSYVIPKYRGKGISTFLVNSVLRRSQVRKYSADCLLFPVLKKRWEMIGLERDTVVFHQKRFNDKFKRNEV